MQEDFFQHYLHYTSGGEVPVCFHRWAAIVGIGAILERNVYLTFGHSNVYPNMYSMLIGNAGTKKSTAIKLIKKLLIKSGYNSVAAERTSKEKYLADLASYHDSSEGEDVLERNIFGSIGADSEITPSLIAADEANDFFGINNIDFLSILGSLWDWEGKYENKIKTGKSDWIPNPTVSILSGNTPTGFSQAFPSSILGSGFFSRLLLIYSEPTGKKVTIPPTPSLEATAAIVQLLQLIKTTCVGVYSYTVAAYDLIDKIHQSANPVTDMRFESYANRRLQHLLKLCLIVAASRFEKQITETTVLQAHTYLRYIEGLMPKALGEFGKAKNSDIAHRVLSVIESRTMVSLKDIFKEVSSELEKPADLGVILQKLIVTEKIQSNGGYFLPLKKVGGYNEEMLEGMSAVGKLVDFDRFLTAEELAVGR